MQSNYWMLVVLCCIAIIILIADILVTLKIKNNGLKIICILLFIWSMLRYFTLIIYGATPTYEQLHTFRYFYFATSMGLAISTVSTLWYITPMYKEKIKYGTYLLWFSPWIMFYFYFFINQPTQITQGVKYGYRLIISKNFLVPFSIMQASIILITILLSIIGMIKYKNLQLRVQYFMIIIAQLTLLVDGISYYKPTLFFFPRFTVSEIFGFLAVCYILMQKPIERKIVKGY